MSNGKARLMISIKIMEKTNKCKNSKLMVAAKNPKIWILNNKTNGFYNETIKIINNERTVKNIIIFLLFEILIERNSAVFGNYVQYQEILSSTDYGLKILTEMLK